MTTSHPLARTQKCPADEMVAELEVEAFEELERLVAKPAYLQALENATSTVMHGAVAPYSAPVAHHSLMEAEAGSEAGSAGWEALPDSGDTAAAAQAEFVVVNRDDALQAMAYYIAQCLAKCPEAQKMSPKQLQEALNAAFKSMKQSRFKQLCTVGRHAYRWTTLTYSALQMYQNPWVIQAIVTALWTISRTSLRFV